MANKVLFSDKKTGAAYSSFIDTRPEIGYNTRMKTIERINALFPSRDAGDMPISTEILLSFLFSNMREQLSPKMLDTLPPWAKRGVIAHQAEMMLNISEDEATRLVDQYCGN